MPINYVKKQKPGEGFTQVTKKHGDEELETKETVHPVKVSHAGKDKDALSARVMVQMGATANLGDFNSVKVLVGLEIPSGKHFDQIEASFETAKEWVESKTQQILDELQGGAVDENEGEEEGEGEEAEFYEEEGEEEIPY